MNRLQLPHSTVIPFYLLLIILFISGCATIPNIEPTSGLTWPQPPDKARIRFVKSVSNTGDVAKIEGGWIKKSWAFLTGENTERVLAAPYGVTEDDDGNVYVADRGTSEIFSFNLVTGNSLSFHYETDDQEDYPIGIGVAKNVYVTYPNSGRVIEFNRKGKVIREIGGNLQRPTGIAVNQNKGLLYVVDTLGHDIKVFDLSGKTLFTFGERGDKDGEFNFPTHIFVAGDGTVYVTDQLNFRIQAFRSDGLFLFKFGEIGNIPGTFESPKGVAVDSDGNIYVADAMSDSIQVFNRGGKLLLIFGGNGSKDGEFAGPSGIFIDKEDRIYVTDLYNTRVQVFQYLKGK